MSFFEKLLFFLAVLLIFLFGFGVGDTIGYKQGQIDYANGIVKYELKDYPNGSRNWELK